MKRFNNFYCYCFLFIEKFKKKFFFFEFKQDILEFEHSFFLRYELIFQIFLLKHSALEKNIQFLIVSIV